MKGTDIKCCAVAWSAKGRYAVASFCKKVGRRNEENTQIQSNIQIYDAKTNKRSHKFDKTYGKKFFILLLKVNKMEQPLKIIFLY